MDLIELKRIIGNSTRPYVLVLVGPPLSGKDTVLKKLQLSDVNIISRDDILMSLHNTSDYNEAFNQVDQKMVDKLLNQKIQDCIDNKKNVIINMTNMTRKRRMYNLDFFGDEYYKVAVIFPILDELEYERRNLKRKEEEQKFIPTHVLKNMISSPYCALNLARSPLNSSRSTW